MVQSNQTDSTETAVRAGTRAADNNIDGKGEDRELITGVGGTRGVTGDT